MVVPEIKTLITYETKEKEKRNIKILCEYLEMENWRVEQYVAGKLPFDDLEVINEACRKEDNHYYMETLKDGKTVYVTATAENVLQIGHKIFQLKEKEYDKLEWQ